MSSLRLFSAPLARAVTIRAAPRVALPIRAYASSSSSSHKTEKGEANPSYAAEGTPKTPSGKSTASKGTDTEDVQRYTRGRPGSQEALMQSDFAQEGDGRHFGKEKAEGESKSDVKAKSGSESLSSATQKDGQVNQTLNKNSGQEFSGQRYQGAGQTPAQVKNNVEHGNAQAAEESAFKKTTDAIKEQVKETAKAAIRTVQPLFTDKVGEGHGVAKSTADATQSGTKRAAEALTGAIKSVSDKIGQTSSGSTASSGSTTVSGGGSASASSGSQGLSSSSKQAFDNQKSIHDNNVKDGFKNVTKNDFTNNTNGAQTTAANADTVVDSAKSTVAAAATGIASAVHAVVDSGVIEAAKQAVGTVVETAKSAGETVVSATASVLETTGLKDHVETVTDKAKMSASEFAKNTQERANELLGTGFGKTAAANERANHIHEAANRMAEEKSETAPGSHRAGDVARATRCATSSRRRWTGSPTTS